MKRIVNVLSLWLVGLLLLAGCSAGGQSQASVSGSLMKKDVLEIPLQQDEIQLQGLKNLDSSGKGLSFDLEQQGQLQFEKLGAGNRNCLTLQVKSQKPLKGVLVCKDAESGREWTYDFFMEAGNEYLSSTLLLNPFNPMSSWVLSGIRFVSPEGKGTVAIRKLELSSVDTLPQSAYIENGTIKAGVNLMWGGGIHYLEALKGSVVQVERDGKQYIGPGYDRQKGSSVVARNVNLLNHHDTGRLVQQSYYGRMDPPYEPATYMGGLWPWNPVQGGDQNGNHSQIVDFRNTGSEIYIKCRPLEWAKNNVATDSYMEAWITLDDNIVKTKCRFVDFSGYSHPETQQELPAVYTAEPLRIFGAYTGDKPFTGDPQLTVKDDLGAWWENYDAHMFKTTEYWSAWVNEDRWGVGVCTPGIKKQVAGRAFAEKLYMGTADVADPTSYMAPLGYLTIRKYEPFEYETYLGVGKLEELRSRFELLSRMTDMKVLKSYTKQ